MDDDNGVYIEQREQIPGLTSAVEKLNMDCQSFGDPLEEIELEKLRSLKNLLELHIFEFDFTPVDILKAVPPEYVWKISLRLLTPFDAAVMESLTRFKNLSNLTISSTKDPGPIKHYPWKRLSELTHIAELNFSGGSDFIETFLRSMNSGKLSKLTVLVGVLTKSCWEALEKLPVLESLSLYVDQIDMLTTGVQPKPSWKFLYIFTGNTANYRPLRDLGVSLGLVRVLKTRGKIGSWGDQGQESPQREFASRDGYMQNWPVTFKAGDELKVLDVSGGVLFDGPLIPEGGKLHDLWDQKGIAPGVWQKWFTSEMSAELTTYENVGDRQFWISGG